jgi:hypothetical protein
MSLQEDIRKLNHLSKTRYSNVIVLNYQILFRIPKSHKKAFFINEYRLTTPIHLLLQA